MPIIAFANQKGNVGKTTSVAYLGYSLQALGYSVQLWDLDNEQFNLRDYAKIVGVPCENPSPSNLKVEIGQSSADFHIVECPPRNETALGFGVECADLLIIPTWAQQLVVEGLVRTLGGVRSNLEKRVLITMYSAPYKEEKDGLMREDSIQCFKTVIPNLAAFSKSMAAQKLVGDYPKGERGAKAYMQLAKEIVVWSKGGTE